MTATIKTPPTGPQKTPRAERRATVRATQKAVKKGQSDGRMPDTTFAQGVEQLARIVREYFLPYQWAWITDESQLKLYPKSRRIGITYGTSFRCVLKCLRNANLTQWVSSKDLELAQEFISQYVTKWCELANQFSIVIGATEIINLGKDSKGNDVTAFQVRFPNGSRIVSLSSNPKKFAGKGGDILIDEMDLHEFQGPLYDMAMPCIDWGGQLEIVSAYDPDGSEETVFAQLVREAREGGNPKGWSLHQTDIVQAVEQGIVEKVNAAKAKRNFKVLSREEFIEDKRKKCRNTEAWLSQYMCQPVNAAGQQAFAKMDLENSLADYVPTIERFEGKEALRIYKPGTAPDPVVAEYVANDLQKEIFWILSQYKGCSFSIGYDVAQKNHLASIAVNAKQGTRKKLVALFLFHGCSGDSQFFVVDGLMAGLGATGAGDVTGPGIDVCSRIATKWGESRWESVNFSASKRELVGEAVGAFERGEQILPREPRYIKTDLAAVRRATAAGGKSTYTEATNELLEESHCDLAYSIMLAIRAAGKCGIVGFESVAMGRGGHGDAETLGRGDFDNFLRPNHDDDLAPTGTERENW